MHKLADVLSAKDAEAIYDFFIDHLTGDVMDRARQSAMAGDIGAANRFARLSAELAEKIAISEGYNLDRKQTIIALLEAIA